MNKLLHIFWITILISKVTGQNTLNNIFEAKSDFVPEIKASEKHGEIPSVLEEEKAPLNFNYGIQSMPFKPSYTIQPIFPSTLKNEPKKRLYYAFMKLGYGPFYSMPMAQVRLANTYSRNYHLQAEYAHLSSNSEFKPFPVTSFSDNLLNLNGKKFYKKHTLNAAFKYQRNVVYHYGYNTDLNTIPKEYSGILRQRYHLFNPSISLKSHYTDTTKINHDLQGGYYHFGTLKNEYENHVFFNALTETYVHGEHLTANAFLQYFNNRQASDTNNHLILALNPAFNAKGRQWTARLGFRATMSTDQLSGTQKFYFHPDVLFEYDIAEGLVIPFVGINGSLQRNSLYALASENPFIDTAMQYANTNQKANFFFGLKGKLSSHTNYLVSATYSITENLPYFFTNYKTNVLMHNYYSVRYVNSEVINVRGEVRFQLLEKWRVNLYGNYFLFRPDTGMKPYHKPEYLLGTHLQYHLGNKILAGIQFNFVGKRWALGTDEEGKLRDYRLNEMIDANAELEYRYTKFLSFFVRLNNLANSRYAVWDKYPTYRFFGMIGLTFIPF
ncbi:MAG: hypothetical protein N3F09_07510 [Bacteroidia bacterium]|nr:hypothetical protein [Bacteroidia bacterium]